MKIFYLAKFLRLYKKLPDEIKEIAEKKEKLFRIDPFDKRLKTHKLHGQLESLWSFSINYEYRIIFEFASKDKVNFFYIGDHDIYE